MQSTGYANAELHGYIDYKANLKGSLATKVPAHYTSKSCPKCGQTSDANRPNKGLLFRCECCGHELHADWVGARNIAMSSKYYQDLRFGATHGGDGALRGANTPYIDGFCVSLNSKKSHPS